LSNLSPLFSMLENAKADELRLTPGEPPCVILDGQRRDLAPQPMNERLILAAASELLSQSELAELPSQRPRTVRHEDNDVLYVIEIARSAAGIGLVIRPAKTKARDAAPPPAPASAHGHAPTSAQGAAPASAHGATPASAHAGHGHAAKGAAAVPTAQVRVDAVPLTPDPPRGKRSRSMRAPSMPPKGRASDPALSAARGHGAAAVGLPGGDATRPTVTLKTKDAPESSGATAGPARIDELLREMLAKKASDLHLSAGNHPIMRVHGEIHFGTERPVLTSSDVSALVDAIMTDKARKDFAELRDCDFAYEIPGLARFRVNVFEDRNGVGSVMRQIPIDILSAEQLGLPRACTELCFLSKGLVVVTGPTGSGKSTTLAAMIDFINKNRTDHIITIEDPVEFVHKNVKCLVNQREVGLHTKTFKGALRAALREDPDIVMVGEMRDLETIAIAIETAETGHLVFGTLHTTTAVSTVDRIIDQFPTDRQSQIRVMLSESLKGVVAQVLCKKLGGGRVAAHEILLGAPAVSNMIREGKTFQLASVMQTSKNLGMVTMNDTLFSLVMKKQVDPKEAWIKSSDKAGLVAMYKNANIPALFI
jgi:twitching motility protein PilT